MKDQMAERVTFRSFVPRSTAVASVLAIALAVALPASAFGQTTPPSPAAEEVRAAFDAIQQAVEARDTARLGELVHPRFAMLHALGQVDSREAWFALVQGGRLPRQTAERRELEPEVVVVGDTALIRSLVQMTYPSEQRTSWMRSTAVFVRDEGRWLQLSQQSSYLYDGPIAVPRALADFSGSFAIPGRDGFSIHPREGYLRLVWANGAILPLVPAGPDKFAAGPTSTVLFLRDDAGQITSVERRGDDGALWWTARQR